MAPRRKRIGWSPAVGFPVLACLLASADHVDLAVFVLLTLFVPYLAFLAPFRCRELTRLGGACRRTRRGWLIGCHDHSTLRLRRIAAILSFGKVLPMPRPYGTKAWQGEVMARSKLETVPAAHVSPIRVIYEALMLIATVVGAVAGAVQAWL